MALDRLTPTTGPKTGTAYATEIQEEVTGLWDRAVCTLTGVAGTNTITATLTPALTGSLQNGMPFILKPAATNTSTVTLNLNGGGAVDVRDAEDTALVAGALRINASYLLRYDSTFAHFVIVGYVPAATLSPMAVLLVSAGAGASIDFTTNISSSYFAYQIVLNNLRPATDDVELWLRISTDGGANYQVTNYDYVHTNVRADTGASSVISATAGAKIILAGNSAAGLAVGSAAEEGVSGIITFHDPASSTIYKPFNFQGGYISAQATPTLWTFNGSGMWKTVTAINAIRIMFESGNITSGTAQLYGMRFS
jgi:hypothetical protein